MATSNAKRQAAYRARVRNEVDTAPAEWLKTALDLHAKRTLERLARHYGVTQRAALERIIKQAQAAVLAQLDGAEQERYYRDPALRRNGNQQTARPGVSGQARHTPSK